MLVAPHTIFAQDVTELKPGIVKIKAFLEGNRKIGTGFVVRLEKDVAVVVTASHVVEGAKRIEVSFFGDSIRSFSGTVIKTKPGDERGLAALKVEGLVPSNVKVLDWDRDYRVHGGEPVTLIGHPRTVDTSWVVTTGSISGVGAEEVFFDAKADEGDSGGPLLYNGKSDRGCHSSRPIWIGQTRLDCIFYFGKLAHFFIGSTGTHETTVRSETDTTIERSVRIHPRSIQRLRGQKSFSMAT